MEYKGMIYAKYGNRYIPLLLSAEDVDKIESENKEFKESIEELLLFCYPDGNVLNGFRTRDIISELRLKIKELEGK
jgi:hypothetical protein